MHCYVRMMQQGDVVQAADIDREAFPTQWPPTNYNRELRNSLAHYIVACDTERIVDEPEVETTQEESRPGLISRFRQLFNRNRLFNNEILPSRNEYVIGLAGFWIMAGEAHITTIAVRPVHHRQGIGEQLLISLIDLAKKLNASILTLEVRISNTNAQRLYSKYGFTRVGLRRGYYTDNREDAILMSTEDINSASFRAHFQQLKQAYSRRRQAAANQQSA